MRTTIDGSGRIVVPKAIRERLQLLDGGDVEITEVGGVIEIVPTRVDVVLVETDGALVAQPLTPGPPLTDDDVAAARDAIRR